MRFWQDEYGADADGNRGIKVNEYELDDSPAERCQIVSELMKAFDADWYIDLDVQATVIITDDFGEGGYEFEVDAIDYADEVHEQLVAELSGGDDLEYLDAISNFRAAVVDKKLQMVMTKIKWGLAVEKQEWQKEIEEAV